MLVENSGIPAISFSHAVINSSLSASFQCVVAKSSTLIMSRCMGRISRTRRSTLPSSCIRLGAEILTETRPERLLTSSLPLWIFSASSADIGLLRSFRSTVNSRVSAPLSCCQTVRRPVTIRLSARIVSSPTSWTPAAIAASMRAFKSSSKAVNSVFCMAIGSASRRLRKVVIGGRSSFSVPPSKVSKRPVASSNRRSEQPSIPPCTSSI